VRHPCSRHGWLVLVFNDAEEVERLGQGGGVIAVLFPETVLVGGGVLDQVSIPDPHAARFEQDAEGGISKKRVRMERMWQLTVQSNFGRLFTAIHNRSRVICLPHKGNP
jgi:hypothetical protein